jgi:hemolysin D
MTQANNTVVISDDAHDPASRIEPTADAPQTDTKQSAQVIQLRPPSRWHDPLQLIQDEPPSHIGRIVLWAVSILVGILIIWAALGKLDIVATAEGKLVPQTLVKIVQPAESGVVKELLVNEGDQVKAGQILATLDTTLAKADTTSFDNDLQAQQMQVRRIQAELSEQSMLSKAGDNPILYAQVQSQYNAHRRAYLDSLEQEESMLAKAQQEKNSAEQVLSKLEQTLPIYNKAAEAYAKLEKDGYSGSILTAEKQREAIEKARDLDAQKSTVAALTATITAQQKKIAQLRSNYRSELEAQLADIRAKISQLQPNLNKSRYKEDLMVLRAPQDGTIKDLATTTVGAVVQPGTVVLTLVPKDEQLYGDVSIKNEDVGFVRTGQTVQVKLATYPFQQYGMLSGKVERVSADATELGNTSNSNTNTNGNNNATDPSNPSTIATYKARIRLDTQTLRDPNGNQLALAPGMQMVAEINQGKRTVLEYMLSPVKKALGEAARER